MHLDR